MEIHVLALEFESHAFKVRFSSA